MAPPRTQYAAQRRHPARLPGASERASATSSSSSTGRATSRRCSGAAPDCEEFLYVARTFRPRSLVRHARHRHVGPGAGRRGGARGLGRRRDRGDGRGGLRARATLVAQGHAAQMALMAAATHPERSRVPRVLYNGFARLARADDYPAGMPQGAQDAPSSRCSRRPGGTGARDCCARSVHRRPSRRRRVVGHASSATPGRPGWRSPRCADDSRSSTCATCSRSSAVPTLVIQQPRQHATCGSGHGRFLAEHILGRTPRSRLDSADHWPAPEPELLGAIEEFVDRLAPHRRGRCRSGPRDRAGRRHRRLHRARERARRSAVERDRETASSEPPSARRSPLYGGRARRRRRATASSPRSTARRARDAVRAADHARRSRVLGLEVRSGLHAGEVDAARRAGSRGIAVHIARTCRLRSQAPARCWSTETVRDLVAGSGIAFEERGGARAQGRPGPLGALRGDELTP